MHNLYNKHLISVHDLTATQVLDIFALTQRFKSSAPANYLQHKLVAQCFFEPSTRTRLSFETAVLRLGGQVIGFADHSTTAVHKGESLADTITVISSYVDLLVIRHPKAGAALVAAEHAQCPVINAGDGANQHPTQALIDLFSIYESQGSIDGLSIALVGDLKYSRTIHSLIYLLALFDVRLYLLSPDILALPDALSDFLKKRGIRFSCHRDLSALIDKLDIVYLTRIQQERCSNAEYQLALDNGNLDQSLLTAARSNLKILHPLPRLQELPIAVDNSPHAYYFQQAANGVPLRQALLTLIMHKMKL